MNYKTDTMLDKLVKEDKINNLKASEISKVKEEEDEFKVLIITCMMSIFTLVIALIALVIWQNKFTLFLSSVLVFINLLSFGLATYQYFNYKNIIKEIINRVNK